MMTWYFAIGWSLVSGFCAYKAAYHLRAASVIEPPEPEGEPDELVAEFEALEREVAQRDNPPPRGPTGVSVYSYYYE